MSALYDKNGRPIRIFDVLKVYHFTGGRRKKHYMHKQVISIVDTRTGSPMFKISHLSRCGESYHQNIDGRHLKDVEIVGGYGQCGNDWFYEREKELEK